MHHERTPCPITQGISPITLRTAYSDVPHDSAIAAYVDCPSSATTTALNSLSVISLFIFTSSCLHYTTPNHIKSVTNDEWYQHREHNKHYCCYD